MDPQICFEDWHQAVLAGWTKEANAHEREYRKWREYGGFPAVQDGERVVSLDSRNAAYTVESGKVYSVAE